MQTMERRSRITKKGQVTIPAEIRRALGVGPHDRVSFVVEDDQVHLRPAQGGAAHTAGSLKAYFPRLPLAAEEERARFEAGVVAEVAEP